MNSFLKLDWVIIIIVILLLCLGLLALYSVSFVENSLNPSYLQKQITAIVIGLVIMFALSFYDYRAIDFYSTKLYFVIIAVLTAVIFWGVRVRGTVGWLGLREFNVQPVEIAKIVMIIFLASFLAKKKSRLSAFMRIVVSVVLISIPVLLVLRQPDFGSASIIIAIWVGMLFVSGINRKNLLVLAIIGAVAFSAGWFLLKDYQKSRIRNFITPYEDPRGSGYNVIQSTVAVGSGGIWGKGLGHGSQSQLNFLPEKRTDFIFAVIAEELGLVGSGIVLILFGVLFYRMKETARLARDNFGYLLTVGVMVMFFVQIFVNIGMNVGISPVAGVPLPLLSYGGSSMVSVLAGLGIAQSVYMRRAKTI
ncbi:MAG: rod shape-determining protein RodA [Candidatus Moranbacteria bacterium RBG_19FT_COMBO_42_6]|nr:MAG: rod shape-determining protein RodA [Candidatus Moranbacteria bacterium RBG_19FT_COMBO_42_6]